MEGSVIRNEATNPGLPQSFTPEQRAAAANYVRPKPEPAPSPAAPKPPSIPNTPGQSLLYYTKRSPKGEPHPVRFGTISKTPGDPINLIIDPSQAERFNSLELKNAIAKFHEKYPNGRLTLKLGGGSEVTVMPNEIEALGAWSDQWVLNAEGKALVNEGGHPESNALKFAREKMDRAEFKKSFDRFKIKHAASPSNLPLAAEALPVPEEPLLPPGQSVEGIGTIVYGMDGKAYLHISASSPVSSTAELGAVFENFTKVKNAGGVVLEFSDGTLTIPADETASLGEWFKTWENRGPGLEQQNFQRFMKGRMTTTQFKNSYWEYRGFHTSEPFIYPEPFKLRYTENPFPFQMAAEPAAAAAEPTLEMTLEPENIAAQEAKIIDLAAKNPDAEVTVRLKDGTIKARAGVLKGYLKYLKNSGQSLTTLVKNGAGNLAKSLAGYLEKNSPKIIKGLKIAGGVGTAAIVTIELYSNIDNLASNDPYRNQVAHLTLLRDGFKLSVSTLAGMAAGSGAAGISGPYAVLTGPLSGIIVGGLTYVLMDAVEGTVFERPLTRMASKVLIRTELEKSGIKLEVLDEDRDDAFFDPAKGITYVDNKGEQHQISAGQILAMNLQSLAKAEKPGYGSIRKLTVNKYSDIDPGILKTISTSVNVYTTEVSLNRDGFVVYAFDASLSGPAQFNPYSSSIFTFVRDGSGKITGVNKKPLPLSR